MQRRGKDTVIIVASGFGRPASSCLELEASAGERPRKDYVELARALDADVLDGHYMAYSAGLLPRFIARWLHFGAGQVAEVFLRAGRYQRVVAWQDFSGVMLALLFKIVRSRRNLALIAQCTSLPKKAILLRRFNLHTHLQALIYQSSLQLSIARTELNVPGDKLHQVPQPVDEKFWVPGSRPPERLICAVGVEARDYATLVEAVRNLDVVLELGVASTSASGNAATALTGLGVLAMPPNVRLSSPSLAELRALYAQSRFVIVSLQEREYDAGSTVVTEAMAMERAVIVTRIRGQVDLLQHQVNGLYVPPGDPITLRVAIEHLLAHPNDAERMGRAGRALVKQRHTLDEYTMRVARILLDS